MVDAEAYYRAMFRGGRDSTWNLRDTHMADTLGALRDHISRQKGRPARIVAWAHNSHIGDARATEMGEVERLDEQGAISYRFDRLRRAQTRQQGNQCRRFDTAVTKGFDTKRTKPFGQLAFAPDQQSLMRKARHLLRWIKRSN